MSQPTKDFQPQVGHIFYSKYFQTNGLVVRYDDEDNWWFKLQSGPTFTGPRYKAKSKPSEVTWIGMFIGGDHV